MAELLDADQKVIERQHHAADAGKSGDLVQHAGDRRVRTDQPSHARGQQPFGASLVPIRFNSPGG